MYIAMNRFRIAAGREAEFIGIWRTRDSRLAEVPGFQRFNLMQGPGDGQATVFLSHSPCDSADAFDAWSRLPFIGAPDFFDALEALVVREQITDLFTPILIAAKMWKGNFETWIVKAFTNPCSEMNEAQCTQGFNKS